MADIDKLFEQINNDVLTEDVKIEMAVLFENAINEAVKQKEEELDKEYMEKFMAEKEDIINKIDMYLEYFCEDFVKKNSNVIQESAKVKAAERVLNVFNSLVQDFHITLDEKKIDSEEKLTESKKEINRLSNELIKSKKQIKLVEKAALISEACSKLETDMEKSKLVEFSKSLPFDELFERKVNSFTKTIISEKIEKKKADSIIKEKIEIKEDVAPVVEETSNDSVSKYVEKL